MTAEDDREARVQAWLATYQERRGEVEISNGDHAAWRDGGIGSLDRKMAERFCRLIVSIELDGYDHSQPVLFNQYGWIVDGRHRLAACQLLGIDAPRRVVLTRHEDPHQ